MSPTRFRQSRAGDGEDLAADDQVQTGRDFGFVARGRLGDREACQDHGRGKGWKQHCGSFLQHECLDLKLNREGRTSPVRNKERLNISPLAISHSLDAIAMTTPTRRP